MGPGTPPMSETGWPITRQATEAGPNRPPLPLIALRGYAHVRRGSPLLAQLLEVRLEGERGRPPQPSRLVPLHVVPCAVEQVVLRARARLQRRNHLPLALQSVLDVLVELRPGVPHDRPVPRTDRGELQRP